MIDLVETCFLVYVYTYPSGPKNRSENDHFGVVAALVNKIHTFLNAFINKIIGYLNDRFFVQLEFRL